MDVTPFVNWLAPIASTVIVAAATASINSKIAAGERKRDEARADTEAKRKAEAEWRESVASHMQAQSQQMSLMTTALQSTMRASLIHNAEKYFSRGSITPEEHASWCDMHDKYSAMGFNGLIDTYREKIDALPHVTVESLMSERHEL